MTRRTAVGAVVLAVGGAAALALSSVDEKTSEDGVGGKSAVPSTSPPDAGRAAVDDALPEGPCPHPYVPSAPGSWWRYRFESAGAPAAHGTWRITSTAPARDGWLVTWHVRLVAADGTQVYARELVRRCEEGTAEDPWYGHPGLGNLEAGPPGWMWPGAPEAGSTVAGELEAGNDTVGIDVDRALEGKARERVSTPAGDLRAWRFSGRDRVRGAAEEVCIGTRCVNAQEQTVTQQVSVWLAEQVGLVRARVREDDQVMTQVLVASGHDGEDP